MPCTVSSRDHPRKDLIRKRRPRLERLKVTAVSEVEDGSPVAPQPGDDKPLRRWLAGRLTSIIRGGSWIPHMEIHRGLEIADTVLVIIGFECFLLCELRQPTGKTLLGVADVSCNEADRLQCNVDKKYRGDVLLKLLCFLPTCSGFHYGGCSPSAHSMGNWGPIFRAPLPFEGCGKYRTPRLSSTRRNTKSHPSQAQYPAGSRGLLSG